MLGWFIRASAWRSASNRAMIWRLSILRRISLYRPTWIDSDPAAGLLGAATAGLPRRAVRGAPEQAGNRPLARVESLQMRCTGRGGFEVGGRSLGPTEGQVAAMEGTEVGRGRAR